MKHGDKKHYRARYLSVPRNSIDHSLVPFRTPMPTRPVQQPEQQIRPDCELGHGGYFIIVLILTVAQIPATAQIPAPVYVPAAVQEDLDDDSEMWNMFLDEVKEEDSRF